MTIDLDHLEALERAATPGPWSPVDVRCMTEEDGDLIAPMRNALPEMIAELRAAREEKARIVAWLRRDSTRETEPAESASSASLPLPLAADSAPVTVWLGGFKTVAAGWSSEWPNGLSNAEDETGNT